jgi:hypothetical protein
VSPAPWKTVPKPDPLGGLVSALSRPAARIAMNLAALGALAGAMLWPTEQVVDPELQRLQVENRALVDSNRALRDELSDLGYKNEIIHWQLRYAEQSLRLAGAAPDASASIGPTPAAPSRVSAYSPRSLAVTASTEPIYSVVITPVEAPPEQPSGTSAGPGLHLEDDDDFSMVLRPDARGSSLQDALVDWQAVVAQAAEGECGRFLATASAARCRDEVSRSLWPYATAAVRCMTSGNAAALYVAKATLDGLPSHSVPLTRGAVILCDGALTNQIAPAL